MKIQHGTQNIGSYQNVPVTLNWDYITSEFGLRRELDRFDKALSFLLRLVAAIAFIAALAISIHFNLFSWQSFLTINSIFGVIFWLCWIMVVYSVFLSRNRNYFDDNLEAGFLDNLQKKFTDNKPPKSISLEDFLDHNVLVMIDESLEHEPHNFLEFIMDYLSARKEIAPLIMRLGLKQAQMEQLSNRVGLEQNTHFDEWFIPMLLESLKIAMNNNTKQIDLVTVFLFLLTEPLKNLLRAFELEGKEVQALSMWVRNNNLKNFYLQEFKLKSPLKPVTSVNRSYTSRYSPVLTDFSRDYTAEVARGDFVLSIGREAELEKLIELVQEGDSSATLVIGAPGVGKTTFIKSFAVRMVCEDVPKSIQDMRLVSFEFNRAFAMSKDIDEFKSKLEEVLEEVHSAGNIILLLEDFDQMVNVRSDFASEVINLVIKGLENYKLRIIATTNPEGYAKHIASREALVSMFGTLTLVEPSDEVAVQILLDDLPELEKKYRLKIEFEALPKAVELSHEFEFDRVLPDKAIELLEETASRAQLTRLSFIDAHQVEDVVSAKVGVNVGKVSDKESQILMHLEDRLHKRLIGQDEAVNAVAAALRRARAGLTKQSKPIASFLFFGPTGVGKTELSKALAAEYYGDEKLMVRLDMSEYQEAENLKRLIGEANNDNFTGGYLTEAVRAKPFSLILLDEIEKANGKVLDLFLQVLDEGHLTDGLGRKVSFANTIIIMTSNACSGDIAGMIEAGQKYIDVYRAVQPKLRQVFRVEFLNRFDKVIMFKPLLPMELLKVVDLQMQKVHDILTDKGIELRWQPDVLKEILNTGYDPVYGAREIRRIIQDYIEDKMAQLIIDGRIKSGSIVNIKNLSEFEVE